MCPTFSLSSSWAEAPPQAWTMQGLEIATGESSQGAAISSPTSTLRRLFSWEGDGGGLHPGEQAEVWSCAPHFLQLHGLTCSQVCSQGCVSQNSGSSQGSGKIGFQSAVCTHSDSATQVCTHPHTPATDKSTFTLPRHQPLDSCKAPPCFW